MKLSLTRNSTPLALIFVVLAGTSSALNANLAAVEVSSQTLSYADLNLSETQDQHTLYQRLQSAAKEVCATRTARTAEQVRESRKCYEAAMEEAVADVGSPGLISLNAI